MLKSVLSTRNGRYLVKSYQQHHPVMILNVNRAYSTGATQSKSKSAKTEFETQFHSTLNANNEGDVQEFTRLYSKLKEQHADQLTLNHYNQLLASCAPKKLMFKWYKPYKDFVDMYHEAGRYYPEEVRLSDVHTFTHTLLVFHRDLKRQIVYCVILRRVN